MVDRSQSLAVWESELKARGPPHLTLSRLSIDQGERIQAFTGGLCLHGICKINPLTDERRFRKRDPLRQSHL